MLQIGDGDDLSGQNSTAVDSLDMTCLLQMEQISSYRLNGYAEPCGKICYRYGTVGTKQR